MTTRTPPAQLTLPGQAHTAEGPLDMSAMYVMHHAFRTDLEQFERAVRRTPLEDAEVWQALAQRWQQFGMVLHHHHTVEDTSIWPPLLARCGAAGDEAARTTLTAMQTEHETIDPQLTACATGFAAMAQDPRAEVRDRLTEDVTATRDGVDRHLAHEETEALPLVQQYLSVQEWAASRRPPRGPTASGSWPSSSPGRRRASTRGRSTVPSPEPDRSSASCTGSPADGSSGGRRSPSATPE